MLNKILISLLAIMVISKPMPVGSGKIVVEIIPKTTVIKSDTTIKSPDPEPDGRKLDILVTYYTNEDNELEGGQYDRMGNLLLSHGEPIIAMPPDVPYGSYIYIKELDTTYKVVDTGGAMKWTGPNQCNVDVFIPNVTSEWLNYNSGKFRATGYLTVSE